MRSVKRILSMSHRLGILESAFVISLMLILCNTLQIVLAIRLIPVEDPISYLRINTTIASTPIPSEPGGVHSINVSDYTNLAQMLRTATPGQIVNLDLDKYPSDIITKILKSLPSSDLAIILSKLCSATGFSVLAAKVSSSDLAIILSKLSIDDLAIALNCYDRSLNHTLVTFPNAWPVLTNLSSSDLLTVLTKLSNSDLDHILLHVIPSARIEDMIDIVSPSLITKDFNGTTTGTISTFVEKLNTTGSTNTTELIWLCLILQLL